ncbi:MAG: AmmeMemoRadiSam system protein B [Candidatus Falkowbacteria bacterium]
MKHKIVLSIIAISLIISLGLIWRTNKALQAGELKNTNTKLDQAINSPAIELNDSLPIGAQYSDVALFLSPIKQNLTTATTSTLTGLIVPHHLLAVDLMAKTFGLAANGKYQNIVVLSPDHFQAGKTDVSVTERNFSTVFGELESDKQISRQLKKLSFVSEGDFFYREHGLGAQLPFIKYYFPAAKITAITFKPETLQSELDEIVEVLKNTLPANSLIVQSTDFSHYLTVEKAQARDQESMAAINKNEAPNILKLQQPDNIDSVAALYVQTKLQQEFFGSAPEILAHKNSQDYTKSEVTSTTSYLTAAYAKPQNSGRANFIFVGDIMLSRYIGDIMKTRQDYNFPFVKIKSVLSSADLVFGNLESPISDQGRSAGHLYSFRADPRSAVGLKDAGFTVLSVANNHAFDYGLPAFSDTLNNLKNNDLAYVGGGQNFAEAHRGFYKEINGIKITILAYTDLLPKSEAATNDQAGFVYLDLKQIAQDIKLAKGKSDLVIVSFHFGREYESKSNVYQQKIAMAAVDAGADLIVGHHPHVAQEISEYKNVSIAYSLGNFVFDQNFSEATKTGLMLKVSVENKKIKSVIPQIINFNNDYQPYY